MKSPEFAKYWAKELGTTPGTLAQLSGGINNRVYRCGSVNKYWVIKSYPARQDYKQDRMQAEVDFLRYANQVAPKRVPKLIAIDSKRRCVVIEHLKGVVYPEGISPTQEDVQEAIAFFKELNLNIDTAKLMINMDASESYQSLREHMQNVYERIAAMGTDHLPIACKDKAIEKLIELREKATKIEEALEAKIVTGEVEDALNPENRCVSPSDYGFHNAIKTPQGIKFIDFEFAGWDDPAKATADFLLQPRVPISKKLGAGFSGFILPQAHQIRLRQNALQPVLRLKWACIILGILKPARLTSMLQIDQSANIEKLIKKRFESSSLYLKEF